jgi:hypothetical protein
MNSISRHRHRYGFLENTLFYGSCHFNKDDISIPGYCEQRIAQDCVDSDISAEEFAQNKIVLCFLPEGHNVEDLKPLTDIMQQTHPGRFMVLFNAVVDTDTLPYHARCVPDFLIVGNNNWMHPTNFDFDTIVPDKKFLCLMRRPSMSRAQLGEFLINNVGVDNVLISFGSMTTVGLNEYRSFFPNHNLPILVDGLIATHEKIYDVDCPKFYSCTFNIVAESSGQTMDAHIWKNVFLTEKTWKVIMQHQLPIWYGVQGTVDQVRQLGFDTFDDILDNHRYDGIKNESERYQQVFELIVNINKQYSLEDCQRLRTQLRPRLIANYERLVELSKSIRPRMAEYIREFVDNKGTS